MSNRAIRRQDRRGERLPIASGASVTDAGLLDIDGADAGLDGPPRSVAVADDLLPPGLVLEVCVGVDPGGDLGLIGLGEHRPRSLPEGFGQDVVARR
jgi:hypothetical protein